ncbi:MAG: hypothetical protein IJ410_07005 [Oscillospiraceae bacterium]|nr:hypothetical protein [Oscillospiraceae bacterium]
MKRLFSLLLLLSFMLTGCSGIASRNNILSLLSSPRLSRRESRIITAINRHLGQDIVLKYPKAGLNVSPVQFVDLNGDNTEEAAVLYSAENTGSNVRMAVLTQSEDEWDVVYDKEGYGTEVYKITFTDMTRSGDRQIVVGYTFSDSSEKITSVYFTDDNAVTEENTYTCQDYVIYDITGDGAEDMILAGVNADNQRTQVRVLSAHYNDYLTSLSVKQIPVRNATVTNIAFSKSDFADSEVILVDYHDAYRRFYTEAIKFDGYNLEPVLSHDVVQKIWNFGYSLNSRDIDGDGYYETPTVIDDGNPYSFNLKQMEWTCFLLNEPVRKYYGVCEARSGVYFPLPYEWQGLISLVNGEKEGEWAVLRTSSGRPLVNFSLVNAGADTETGAGSIIVGKGTIQVKLIFAREVTAEQRDYISEGMMYIK